MRSCAWTASLQQPAGLDLQPHEPWPRHVGAGPAPALVLRVSVYVEWHRVRCGAGQGRWLAFAAPPSNRSAGRAPDVPILRRFSLRETGGPPMAASRLQYEVQRAPARSLLLCSGRRVPLGRYGMGDSQALATPLAGSVVWRVQRSACVAFLADVDLHPICGAACVSGF